MGRLIALNAMLVPLPFWVLAALGVALLWASRRAALHPNHAVLAGGAAFSLLLALAWAACDIWSFRDGYPVVSPDISLPESHGWEATRIFARRFAIPLAVVLTSSGLVLALATPRRRR